MFPKFSIRFNTLPLMFSAAMLIFGTAAYANSIPIFNTGVDSLGVVLPDGTLGDPHYSLFQVPGGTNQTLIRTAPEYPIPPYLGDNNLSRWIGPNGSYKIEGPAGLYIYRTTFDLSGLVASTATLSGLWAVDNVGVDIKLNGNSLNFQIAYGVPSFQNFYNWSATNSAFFVNGINTLDFYVENGNGQNDLYGPTALRVEVTGSATATPEPGFYAALAIGLSGLAFARRRSIRN